MAPRLNAIGIVVSDMARSLGFYRRLGFDVPDTPHEGHVEIALPNGWRLMLDSEDVMRSFLPNWVRQSGNQVGLAVQCDSPTEVDQVYVQMTAAGYHGDKEP